MIVRKLSNETFIMTQKYVLMITTESIFTYLSHVYCSLHTFTSRDANEMKEMHFVHIFNIYSMVIYRFGRNGSRLDVTDVIAYNNGYNGNNNHPFQKDLTISFKYLDIYKLH